MDKSSNDNRTTALYVRVSTDAQYEEGYSVDVQTRKLIKWCELHDIENYSLFVDGGYSGSNLNRPEVQKMITEIKNKNIKNVVVYKLDRLSRSQKDTVFLLEDIFEPHNTGFISLNESFDTTTPYGKAMIGILSVFAQLERENIKERTKMGMNERIRQGLWMGGGRLPFGYDYDPKKGILIKNNDSKTVKKIFDLYLEGYSTTKLASLFNFKGDKQICDILDRKTYAGYIVYNGEEIKALHEPIISEETFNKVKKIRSKKSRTVLPNSDYLLTGLIYCGKCGAKMRYQKWGNNGQVKIYCYSQQKSKKYLIKNPNCDNKKYDAREVEKLVIKDIFNLSLNLKDKKNGKKIITAYEILNQKKENTALKLKRLYNLYAENEDRLLLETINETKKEYNKILKDMENEKAKEHIEKNLTEKLETIKTIAAGWEYMNLREKQTVLRSCINKITIADDKIDIHYSFEQ